MESRVMGNCHARFGAGENLEERICSLRLHIPPKGLPIAILRDGSGCNGEQTSGIISEKPLCRSKPFDGAMGSGVSAVISGSQYPGSNQERF